MKSKINNILLIIALAITSQVGYSHDPVYRKDSLLQLLKADKEDTVKLTHLNKLSMEYFALGKTDSIEYYNYAAIQLSQKFLNSENKDFVKAAKKHLLRAYTFLGIVNYQRGNYNEALEHFEKDLELCRELKNKASMANTFGNMGLVYFSKGNYPEALDNNLKALKLVEELKDKAGIAKYLLNISGVYYERGDYETSLDYDLKVLSMAEELGNMGLKGMTYGNIGIIYSKQRKHGKALEHYYKSLKIALELKDGKSMTSCYGNIGQALQDQGDSAVEAGNKLYAFSFKYSKSKEYFLLGLKTAEEFGILDQIPTTLGHLGLHYLRVKNYKEASYYLFRSLKIADSIGTMNLVKDAYRNLSFLYEKSTVPLPDSTSKVTLSLEQTRLKSIYYYKKFIGLRDSIFSQENQKQMLQKQLNYDFEKRSAAIKAVQAKKDIQIEEEKQRQSLMINCVSIGLILVLIIVLVIWRSLRQNQRKNKIISEQKRLVEKQKELVEEKQKEILDSIQYAQRIQRALITSEKYFEKSLFRLSK